MTIPLEQARKIIKSFQSLRIKNLFAQSHARHVLLEVNESPDNFPAFDILLEDKVTFTAYALLSASCSMLELQAFEEGTNGIETAAALLQNEHGPFVKDSHESSFHVLISSMAFYAAGHYSRAFVSIRQVENTTEAARVIATFIRKDTKALIKLLNAILLRNNPNFDNQQNLDEWIITITIARSMSLILEYISTGNKFFFNEADKILQDALLIAQSGLSPTYWWIVRLLKLMFYNFGNASLWKNLPPFFDSKSWKYVDQYIRLLAFSKPPIIELWTSQCAALTLALNPTNRGGVINLRTSAGKTRVAELTILQTLSSNPLAKVVYLAPFRSLAFEVERTLSMSFSWLGFQVSHLYGGSRVSSVDTDMVSTSAIIIATPEKARALFRANTELFKNVKLIIIDEGHLIGPSERYVKNELFVDHLRTFARSTGTRILLLSAVLSNAQELAEWVAGDAGAIATSAWKPSAERFGLLRWSGTRVRIDWLGKFESFNPSFVGAKPLGFGKRKKPFPNDKNEAIAATAIRLTSIGPVMIFTGKAVSVPTLATAILLALGQNPKPHPWPEREWKIFKTVCEEELNPDSIEIKAARAGVICHSNRLTPQVRMAIEHLMRSYAPKIIIATTTLGQGVNIGISSVIVATPYIGKKSKIDKKDFWNICGRAGRAFVDGEGKILYAIDEDFSSIDHLREKNHVKWQKLRKHKEWQIKNDVQLAQQYFSTKIDRIESGLLFIINTLRRIAEQAGVSFDVLIELVANNDFGKVGEKVPQFEAGLDLLDDELLALHEDISVNHSIDDSVEWIDQAFRESLAAIQARSGIGLSTTDDVIRFLEARVKSTLMRIPNKSTRKAVVASGLPLSVAIKAHDNLDHFRTLTDEYLQSDMSLASLSSTVQKFEIWARANGSSVTDKMPEESVLNKIRNQWLGGIGLREITKNEPKSDSICKDFYGYQLPWIIHAISQNLDTVEEQRFNALAQIALIVEIGVPTELAARIFLAGIHSRMAATELSQLGIEFGSSVSTVNSNLRNPDFTRQLISQISPTTAEWLNLILADEYRRKITVPHFDPLTLEQALDIDTLYVRTFNDGIFLCSLDGSTRIPVKSSESLPFDKIADDLRFAFAKQERVWHLAIRDPRCEA